LTSRFCTIRVIVKEGAFPVFFPHSEIDVVHSEKTAYRKHIPHQVQENIKNVACELKAKDLVVIPIVPLEASTQNISYDENSKKSKNNSAVLTEALR
jgi:hypothetical protein